MTTRTFPIVVDTWTERERGWGSRHDGMTLHLSTADHKAFVDDFNKKYNSLPEAPDEYTAADMSPKVVDVPESLYQRLVDLKAKGETGLWAPSREAEKMILAGEDPYAIRAKRFDVVMTNVKGNPKDPLGENLKIDEAKERVAALAEAGIECGIVERKPEP